MCYGGHQLVLLPSREQRLLCSQQPHCRSRRHRQFKVQSLLVGRFRCGRECLPLQVVAAENGYTRLCSKIEPQHALCALTSTFTRVHYAVFKLLFERFFFYLDVADIMSHGVCLWETLIVCCGCCGQQFSFNTSG
ncbi:hypothetical protein, unlikely [Trypanosoma brucei gambiense DAL972]|uniref:Uncharacterized protein n=1 Tax=Trypanosoma brucei gambiense (strain MHOM/CI/86/DAL972) TaxID=679716 RepID=D0A193_TRYB9|nr:hypothetical protein, unlikely [Trypanosoma brucei gambiense DAL972]CBH15035.1 hypothetical protein, unlikely [Trypanosoma brucei gambiense DAL972]|eukprot:XP_011777301.1 hypothetical protein, unlikely [Trypanosoma brucei gambiense DAL972]